MPFTPFHFGWGYSVAAVERKPRLFCFFTFVITQVVIDVETLRNMLTQQLRLHTFFHTFLGSLVAAGIAVLLVIASYGPGRWILLRLPQFLRGLILDFRLFPEARPVVSALLLSALYGAWSHVLLDAIMHSDTLPFAPFSEANPFHELISMEALMWLGIGLVLLGWAVFKIRRGKLVS